VNKESVGLMILRVALGVGLLTALFLAGWKIYSRLPENDSTLPYAGSTDGRPQIRLSIVLGNALSGASLNSPAELYPFDLTAAQREYQASPQLARTFDDFLARRMRGVKPVPAPTDSRGRMVVMIGSGDWWLRATAGLAGGETIEWRLPLAVSGREQTVELTLENAYEKTKKF
jgi:hypothetical protein